MVVGAQDRYGGNQDLQARSPCSHSARRQESEINISFCQVLNMNYAAYLAWRSSGNETAWRESFDNASMRCAPNAGHGRTLAPRPGIVGDLVDMD